MPKPAPQAAKLVREAAAVLADDMSSVGFAISHWKDTRIRFEDTLAETNRRVPADLWNIRSTRNRVLWTETLTTVAYGVATVIVAARTAGQLGVEPGLRIDVLEVSAGTPGQRGCAFYGLAHPNPSFLYRGVDELDVIIQLPSDPKLGAAGARVGDALTLGRAIAEVASVAAGQELPLMLVQSPMAAPPDGGDTWRLAQAPGVRCAIALPSDGIREQFEISTALYQWAEDAGCALYVGDRRGDSRRGRWHQLLDSSRPRYEDRVADLPRFNDRLTSVLPVTFVGPARVGTTAAIMRYLTECRVPVLSASVTPLENLAFINILVGIVAGSPARPVPDTHGPAADILADLGRLGLTSQGPSGQDDGKVRDAAPRGYSGCVGRVMEVRPLDVNERALWASWQFPEASGAPLTAIEQLREAVRTELGEEPDADAVNVQYVVCRRGNAQDLRGRCKVAVPAEVEPRARPGRQGYERDQLCRRIESRWRSLLDKEAPRSIIDVDLTWEESRLGRWLSPPGGARGDLGAEDDGSFRADAAEDDVRDVGGDAQDRPETEVPGVSADGT